MSYKNKLNNYQGDCDVILGNFSKFSDYIKNFSMTLSSNAKGIDIGAGPGGCNGKFFSHCKSLIGCDADSDVVGTLPHYYRRTFKHIFGKDTLSYDGKLDFAILSCMIQHLNSFQELEFGISEVSKCLKEFGQLYLMFKAGSNDTDLTHFNEYYQEIRTFRVFHPKNIKELCSKFQLFVIQEENLLDENYIPYVLLIFQKL